MLPWHAWVCVPRVVGLIFAACVVPTVLLRSLQVGDILIRCSAVLLKDGTEGQFEKEGCAPPLCSFLARAGADQVKDVEFSRGRNAQATTACGPSLQHILKEAENLLSQHPRVRLLLTVLPSHSLKGMASARTPTSSA